LLEELDERLRQLQYVAADDYGPEGAAQLVVLDDEERAYAMTSLRDVLVEAAADPYGQDRLAMVLELILPNPYPQYRDIALEALGVAVLAAADPPWVRRWLRRILQVGLDQEGVTFTFDLSSMLVMEAERRGGEALQLRDYVDRALDSDDRWGTSVRAHSAMAAALFRLGNRDEAFGALRYAAQRPTGFAGFATLTMLSLANRWLEFGAPDEANDDLNDAIQAAERWAGMVNDYGLRMRRTELVQAYRSWLLEEVPTFEAATAKLQATPDQGTRRTYKDTVSARWSWPPDQPNLEALKAFVPRTLVDGTRLDAVLGRLTGLLIRKLGVEGLLDEALEEAIEICQRSLATGAPWGRDEPVGPS
jgi:tetratricopeptide (TPR) repeat protein